MVTPIFATEVAKVGRVQRRPQHPFYVEHYPYVLQPFCLAPVMPGETMKNALLQARCVTDPVANPLIGWWLEHYLFYVKHRDLRLRDEYTNMVLDPEWDPNTAGVEKAAADANYYHAASGIPWARECLEVVTNHYFRNAGEDWADFAIGGMPVASVTGNTWMDSLVAYADLTTASDQDLDVDADGTIMASEAEMAMQMYQLAREQGLLGDMTYEDYLRSYGIRIPIEEDEHRPELIRYSRSWTYPTNTVDPTDGSPSSAMSWSIAERADKDRFFREPGFIFGVTCARPKTYMANQDGTASWLMRDAKTWLPAVLSDDPWSSLALTANGEGPLSNQTDADGYWVDIKDLLVYGEQYVNVDMSSKSCNAVALPTAAGQRQYLTSSSALETLFVSASHMLVKQDGIVNLNILGRTRDTTPTLVGRAARAASGAGGP